MKTVFLIRHAKSSWADLSLPDIKRPLNKRGFRDAPFMADLLKGKGVRPDRLLSSPAKRAYTTATYFAKAFSIGKDDIVVEKSLYEAYANDVLELIQTLEPSLDTVCIFGHNPTFTSLVNMFDGEYIPNVPTCGIVSVEAEVGDWKKFTPKKGRLAAFYYPKQYLT